MSDADFRRGLRGMRAAGINPAQYLLPQELIGYLASLDNIAMQDLFLAADPGYTKLQDISVVASYAAMDLTARRRSPEQQQRQQPDIWRWLWYADLPNDTASRAIADP